MKSDLPPEPDAVDASGSVTATPQAALDEKADDHKAELAALLLALLGGWRKTILIELRREGWPLAETDLERWAEGYAGRTIDLMNATTRRAVDAALAEAGASAATGAAAVAEAAREAVARIFQQAIDARALLAGDTAATAAMGFAAASTYQATGIDAAEWISMRDAKVRDTHRAMDGQIRELGRPFTSPSGAMAYYPGGFGIAEEDCNCRCVLGPATFRKADTGDRRAFWRKRQTLRAGGARKIAALMCRQFEAQKAATLAALGVEKLAKHNPNHDAQGRFTFITGNLGEFLSGRLAGSRVVAKLPTDIQDHLKAQTSRVILTAETRDTHDHHKWTVDDFKRLQHVIDRGEVRTDRQFHVAIAKRDGVWRYAVLKVTKDRKAVYLQSFHKVRTADIERFRKRGALVRDAVD